MPDLHLVGSLVPLHGLGGARDLPIPAVLAVVGATAALTISFCVLTLAWRTPRYPATASAGRPVPAPLARVLDSPWFSRGLQAFGLVFAGYFVYGLGVYIGTFHVPGLPEGGPDLRTNMVFGIFFVWLWVGIVPASLLFGRIYRAVNPVRSAFRGLSWVLRVDPAKGVFSYPEKLGYWPAAVGLFAFVWQELINPQGTWLVDSGFTPGLRTWLLIYVVVLFLGASLFGETWFARADPFEVYSDLLAKMSFWGRRDDGVLVFRSPLANLATLTPRPGTVAVVAVLVGTTAFDSYKGTKSWSDLISSLGGVTDLKSTLAMLVLCVLTGVVFSAATMAVPLDPDDPAATPRRTLPQLYAHSVVPIVVGYMTAHYLSYLVMTGQDTLRAFSDPMLDGSNLFGTADLDVNYWLPSHPTFLAWTKVFAVVLGHIVGVVAAHDRALAVLPKKQQVTGQIGLLFVMLAFTSGALWLLFGASA